MTTSEASLTAEEYLHLPGDDHPTELVRGRIITLDFPDLRHGKLCALVSRLLGNYAEQHALGHTLSNNAGIVTQRNPDTVRGPDISFFSYSRIPKGAEPAGYPPVMPEVAIEVRSATDRWAEVLEKVSEYLNAGVDLVYVVDAQTQSVVGYAADQAGITLRDGDELTFPPPLDGLRIAVRRVFAP